MSLCVSVELHYQYLLLGAYMHGSTCLQTATEW